MTAKECIINVLKEQLPAINDAKINAVATVLEKELHLEDVKFINLKDVVNYSGVYNPFE